MSNCSLMPSQLRWGGKRSGNVLPNYADNISITKAFTLERKMKEEEKWRETIGCSPQKSSNVIRRIKRPVEDNLVI